MAKYTIISGQNIYDVALHIYGSIEGVVDLMMCNPSLSLDSVLRSGDELVYTDDFVIDANLLAYFRTNSIIPANGERRVYMKESTQPLFMEVQTKPSELTVSLTVSGWGEVEVDWGDNTPIEKISFTEKQREISHTFDNRISEHRRIRFYGTEEIGIMEVDLTHLKPTSIYLFRSLYAERIVLNGGSMPIDFLSLCTGVYELDLAGIKTTNLLPLVACEDLMRLDLRNIRLTTDVIDAYLIALVRNYQDRRNCHIRLSFNPSGKYGEPGRDENGNYNITSGLQAVWVLTNEPEWNKGGSWIIELENITYTYKK